MANADTDSERRNHLNDTFIQIPRNSFTAFRLKYCDALELYNTSTVIFLGNIPNVWILDKKSILLAKINRLDNLNSLLQNDSENHPEHNTLKNYENAIHFTDINTNTNVGNKIENNDSILYSNHGVHDKVISSLIQHSLQRPNLRLKSNEKYSMLDVLSDNINHLHPPLSSFLVNISPHFHPVSHSNNKNAHFTSKFNFPREAVHLQNLKLHLLMNNSNNNNNNEKCTTNRNINSFPHDSNDSSDDIEHNSSSSLSPSPINQSPHMLPLVTSGKKGSCLYKMNNEIPPSLRSFLKKSDEEKQQILKEEIDNAMLSLQKNHNSKSKIFSSKTNFYSNTDTDTETETDEESYVTASESIEEDPSFESKFSFPSLSNQSHPQIKHIIPPTPMNNQINLPKERKSVLFQNLTHNSTNHLTPFNTRSDQLASSTQMNNSTSLYTLQSLQLPLGKQTPFPYSKHNSQRLNESNNIYSEKNENNKINVIVRESYDDIDDEIFDTYKLLKTKTLGAKLGLNDEINKFEHKRKMKKLLQNFQAGEIIKMEKMLVMVSTIEKFKLNSELKKSSRIVEKWREYIVVVRATNDLDYPAIIQFFKSNKIFRKDDLGKLKREIYQEELEKQKIEDEEEAKKVQEAKAREERDVDIDTDALNLRQYGTIDETLDESEGEEGEGEGEEEEEEEENNSTLNNSEQNVTLKETFKKLKKAQKRKIAKRKAKMDKRRKKFNINTDEECLTNLNKPKKDRNCHFSLVLTRHDVTVDFANLLDKSIRITKERKNCIFVYTLLAHSTSSAVVWLSFLRHLINYKVTRAGSQESLLISIPSLNVSFTITGKKSFHKANLDEYSLAEDFINVQFHQNGYKYPQIKGFERKLDMIQAKINELEKSGKLPNDPKAKKFLYDIKNDRSFLALTFRKYDRLEWILGENESLIQILWNIYASSYELELREFQHESHILNDHTQIEPLPVEGFLVKLSNRRGKLTSTIGRQYYKLLYAFTVENLLFFQDFFNAVPILPNCEESQRHLISPAGDILQLKELENASLFEPTVYQYTPYPITAHHIKWLRPGITRKEYEDHDSDALYEAERRACMISNANAIVDLCKVTDIRLIPKQEINTIVRTACRATWTYHINGESSLLKKISGHTSEEENDDEYIENCFELIMENGSTLRLQVSTRTIRNEWVRNLGKLSEYWTLKKQEDLVRHVVMKEKNLNLLNTTTDDYVESIIANENETSCSKWELSKAYTDTQLYSISSYVLDKPVLMEGYLYCRKFKSKQFKLYYAVLSPGFFVVYDVFKRSKGRRVARNTAYYRRYAAISLASCYVFASTGKSNTDSKGEVFFSLSSGEDGLPRVYADGWRSSESSYERSFTIWFGSKKIMMKNIKKKTGTKLKFENDRFLDNDQETYQTSSETEESSTEERDTSGEEEKEGEENQIGDIPLVKEKRKKKHRFGKFNFGKYRKHRNNYNNNNSNNNNNNNNDIDDGNNMTSSDFDTETESNEDSSSYFDSDASTFNSSHSKNIFSLNDFESTDRISTTKLLKSVSKLGVTGKAVNFMARSRVDRDIWVTRLMTEIERFSGNRSNDIQLV